MKAVRVHVEKGQISGRAPAGFPEGDVDVCLAEPDDDMTPEEEAELWRRAGAASKEVAFVRRLM